MELAIAGVGMETSLGGVVGGSAALRAGLTRPVHMVGPMDAKDGAYGLTAAHRAVPDSDDLAGVHLWRRMALGAMQDLLRYSAVPDLCDQRFWRRTAVMVALPDLASDSSWWAKGDLRSELRDAFPAHLLESLELADTIPCQQSFAHGQSAVARSVASGRALIEARQVDRALVVAVDSLVDPQRRYACDSRGSLVAKAVPRDWHPSEAAACLLVERLDACLARSGRVEAMIREVAVVGDVARPQATPWQVGRHLAAAILQGQALDETSRFRGDIHVDLNGDPRRAQAWCYVQQRLISRVDFARSQLVHLERDLGDTGAAGPALAVCLAVRSFARGCARGADALVCTLSDPGDVTAIALRDPVVFQQKGTK